MTTIGIAGWVLAIQFGLFTWAVLAYMQYRKGQQPSGHAAANDTERDLQLRNAALAEELKHALERIRALESQRPSTGAATAAAGAAAGLAAGAGVTQTAADIDVFQSNTQPPATASASASQGLPEDDDELLEIDDFSPQPSAASGPRAPTAPTPAYNPDLDLASDSEDFDFTNETQKSAATETEDTDDLPLDSLDWPTQTQPEPAAPAAATPTVQDNPNADLADTEDFDPFAELMDSAPPDPSAKSTAATELDDTAPATRATTVQAAKNYDEMEALLNAALENQSSSEEPEPDPTSPTTKRSSATEIESGLDTSESLLSEDLDPSAPGHTAEPDKPTDAGAGDSREESKQGEDELDDDLLDDDLGFDLETLLRGAEEDEDEDENAETPPQTDSPDLDDVLDLANSHTQEQDSPDTLSDAPTTSNAWPPPEDDLNNNAAKPMNKAAQVAEELDADLQELIDLFGSGSDTKTSDKPT